ncbi:MAG: hypothetical protein FWD86_02490 [Firmicutes bacterium]|nr:hypothetical protein [Bacillota bacterium]
MKQNKIHPKQKSAVLNDRQIFICRIVIAISALILGLFLLLVGVGVFDTPYFYTALISALYSVGITFLILSFIQDNTLLMWLSPIFILSAVVSTISVCSITTLSYQNLYPIYIISPAIASALTCIYSKNFYTHIKVIIPLSITAANFSLNSFFNIPWQITIPVMLFSLCLAIVLMIILSKKLQDKNKRKD